MPAPRFVRPAALTILASAALATSSGLAAMPSAVEAMIREAVKSGDNATVDAVVKVAKATNPEDAEDIATLAASLQAEASEKAEKEKTERLAAQNFFDGWSGEGQAGVGFTSGNTREQSMVLGVSLQKQGRFARHKLTGVVDYLRSNGTTTRQKYGLGYSLNYKLEDGLSLVGTLGWERDQFAGYARRFTESVGLGYRVLDGGGMTLDLDVGPALRQTRFVDDGSESEFAGRGALTFRWHLSEDMLFSEDASALSGSDNTTLISKSALTAKINGSLSARLSFNVQKETDPPIGRESTDMTSRATLVYDF